MFFQAEPEADAGQTVLSINIRFVVNIFQESFNMLFSVSPGPNRVSIEQKQQSLYFKGEIINGTY